MQRRKSVSRIFELIVGGLGALVSLVSSSFILLIAVSYTHLRAHET